MHRTLLVCLGLTSAVSLLGCSSNGGGDGGSPGGPCVDLTQLPTSPTISFTNDVMPIFAQSCIASSCHDKSVKKATLELGDSTACTNPNGVCYSATAKWSYQFPPGQPTPALVQEVLQNLVNVPSKTLASVPRVKPGDPDGSFLIHKLFGDQDTKFDSTGQCQNQDTSTSTTPCGSAMPLNQGFCQNGEADRVQAIAQWIAQGAQAN